MCPFFSREYKTSRFVWVDVGIDPYISKYKSRERQAVPYIFIQKVLHQAFSTASKTLETLEVSMSSILPLS